MKYRKLRIESRKFFLKKTHFSPEIGSVTIIVTFPLPNLAILVNFHGFERADSPDESLVLRQDFARPGNVNLGMAGHFAFLTVETPAFSGRLGPGPGKEARQGGDKGRKRNRGRKAEKRRGAGLGESDPSRYNRGD